MVSGTIDRGSNPFGRTNRIFVGKSYFFCNEINFTFPPPIVSLAETISSMSDEVVFKVGRMTKDPRSMTREERIEWQKETAKRTRDYLFSIGQPLVYKRDGRVVAEHKDGRVQIIR
jgi:hypothetical protein